jgi:hypothetical protein
MLLGEALWLEVSCLKESLQSRALRGTQPLEATLDQVTDIAKKGSNVCHRTKSYQIQGTAGLGWREGSCELIGDSHASEVAQGMVRRKTMGIDDRQGCGQAFFKRVMIGDDHVYAQAVSLANRSMGGDARVAGDQEPCPLCDKRSQPVCVQAMALLARGDVKDDIGTDLLQGFKQQTSRRLAVHIKITPDGNALAAPDSQRQAVAGFLKIWQIRRRCGLVGIRIEEGAYLGRSEDASARQRLGHKRMPTHRVIQRGRDIYRTGLNPSHQE